MNTTVEKAIILPVIVIFLFAMTLIFINHLSPYIYYTKISDITRKHVMAIEESGGLTAAEKEKILDELQARGIPKSRVSVISVPELDVPVPYGNPISITVTFNYQMDDIKAATNGATFSLSKGKKDMPVVVAKTGISRLSQE